MHFRIRQLVILIILPLLNVMAVKNTTLLLQRLRALMRTSSAQTPALNAYIIPSGDAHLSEYIAPCDARRAYISGFTGSFGVAVVTDKKAALWTDGRYFIQASEQLDDNWTLMKLGVPTTPSQDKWLNSELPPNGKVGVDPYMLSESAWQDLSKKLEVYGHSLIPVWTNLIDQIWEDKPPMPSEKIFVHKLEFAGQTWQEKISSVRSRMEESRASAMVLSALDEVSWILNLRGSDIPFNPVFFSYLVISNRSVILFINESKLTDEVRAHLNVSSGENEMKVEVRPYGQFLEELKALVESTSDKIWVSPFTNQAIFSVIPKAKLLKEYSPVAVMKAVKNEVEIQGMKNCHIRDAVALCQFFSWLETEAPKRNVTEVEAADYSEDCRKRQSNFVSLSFDTISSTGPDGAIIHYHPTPETDKVISPSEIYLIDSGAQYLDGTTDITRTIHMGEPNEYEKECFTLVLKGHIALDSAVFPNEVKGRSLDGFARQYLWKTGLDYRHGTGHGVGSFLNVHEGPMGISEKYRPDEIPLKKGMVLSNEPGFYEDGKFGIRIENLCTVVEAKPKYNYQGVGFLTFEMLSFVPIQTKLINKSLLTEEEVKWVNDYNKKCRDVVGAEIQRQNITEGLQWLLKETEPLV